MIFISVLLPAPFSPTIAWNSPGPMSTETSERATTPGKRLVIRSMETMGADIVFQLRGSGESRLIAKNSRVVRRSHPGMSSLRADSDGPTLTVCVIRFLRIQEHSTTRIFQDAKSRRHLRKARRSLARNRAAKFHRVAPRLG